MYNHYKDLEPEQTVQKIKSIFNDLNVEVDENWFESSDNLYSLQLNVSNTALCSNGKGVSEELARASAYAELMERIQNGIIFRLLDNYNHILEKVNKINTKSSIPELKKIMSHINNYLHLYDDVDEENKKEILNLFEILIKNSRFEELIIYKNINGEKICLPSLFRDIYYGSNGLAAGNTRYEALTQALCEVMERYTVKKVLLGELKKHSNITSYVKETIKVFNRQIEEIEKTGLVIKFLDISMETNLPVVMSVLIDPKNRKYFINCASHSSLILAIERTITETFQGRTLKEISDYMTPITASCENKIQDNINSIFLNGEGIYPIDIFNFQDMDTYPGSVWEEFEPITSNKQISKIIIDKLQKQGFSVYIADFSHCGFPTYQVIIPGMSEITDITDTSVLKKLNSHQKVKTILTKLNPSKDEIYELIDYFTSCKFSENYILKDFFRLPLMNHSSTSLDALDINLLLAIAYGYVEDFNSARAHISKYNEKLFILCDNKDIINYYAVVENVFNLQSQYKTNDDIINILSVFFDKSIVKEVLIDVSKEKILKNLPRIRCINQQNCHSCELKDVCSYDAIGKVLEKISECKIKNVLNDVSI